MNGEYRNTVDEKGRLMLPAKLREVLSSSGLWLTRSTSGSLWLFTDQQFQAFSKAVNYDALSILNKNAALIDRFVISPAREVELDKTGRLGIPPFLRDYASIGLKEECVILCSATKVEIMGAAKYDSQLLASLEMLSEAGNELSMMRMGK